MGNKYVYNSHIAPVNCNIRDAQGKVLSTKVFLPERIDGTTGRTVGTGYTMLTEDEFKQLCETSRTFSHYKDKLKLLSVRDDVPPDAKQPHEALADARREAREAQARAAALEAEVEKLKVRALDAEDRLGQLTSASTDAEKLKPLNDRIASLESDKAAMRDSIDRLTKERDQLRADLEAAGKKRGKDFS